MYGPLPHISQYVEHDQVESLLFQFYEGQVSHQKATHEEKGVNTVVTICNDLNLVGCSVSNYYLNFICSVNF